jgi:hypothetical protein
MVEIARNLTGGVRYRYAGFKTGDLGLIEVLLEMFLLIKRISGTTCA